MCQVLLTISERVIEGLPVQAAGDNNTVIYYDYTVEEVSVPAGYSSSTAGSVGYTYKFTNTHRLTLPVAGAGGDMMMTLTGVLIVIFGVLTFGKKRKHRSLLQASFSVRREALQQYRLASALNILPKKGSSL